MLRQGCFRAVFRGILLIEVGEAMCGCSGKIWMWLLRRLLRIPCVCVVWCGGVDVVMCVFFWLVCV